MKRIDLIGKTFNRLTVIKYLGAVSSKRDVYWTCKCKCGGSIDTTTYRLRSGKTKSCGCTRRESLTERNTTHGHSSDPIYRVAHNVILRGRGKVTRRLKHIYDGVRVKNLLGDSIEEVYRKLKTIPGYFEGAQIDRIDNDGNYTIRHYKYGNRIYEYYDENLNKTFKCRGNLRWVTASENVRNSRISKPKKYYETKYSTRSNFNRVCDDRGWNFNNFKETYSNHMNSTGRNKMYFYKEI